MQDQPIPTETVTSSPSPEQASPQPAGTEAPTSAPVVIDERTHRYVKPPPAEWTSDEEVFAKLFPGETLNGKAAPTTAPESPQAAPEQAPAPEPQVQPATAQEPDALMEKALATLRRDEIPSSAIEKMSREQVLAYGEKRAKIREGIESAYRELAELKKSKGSGPENRTEPQGQPSALNLAEIMKPFAETHEPETVKALEKTLQALSEQITANLSAQYEGRAVKAEAAAKGVAREFARAQLTQMYGQPIPDEAFAKVLDAADRLIGHDGGGYQSLTEALRDAARARLGEPKSNTYNQNGTRANGQPTVAARAPVHAPKSRDEAWMEAMLARDRGMSISEAQRIAESGFKR